MDSTQSLIERVDHLHGKAMYFIVSMALMGMLLIGASLFAWQSSHEQQRLAQAHRRTLRVLSAATDVQVGALDMLRGERDYLLTEDKAHLRSFDHGRARLDAGLDRMRRTAGESDDVDQVVELESAAARFRQRVDTVMAIARTQGVKAAEKVVERTDGRDVAGPVTVRVHGLIDVGKVRLKALTVDVDHTTRTLLRFVYLTSLAGLCLLVLAAICAIALRRSYAAERAHRTDLRKRAETDELTGIANRGELLRYLDTCIATARRTGTPLSFAMFDIDNFKRVNDSYGHGVGDEAIRYVVRTAQKVVRINDRIGRLGGEEFGIVLPKSAKDSSVQVCERLRQRLHAQGFSISSAQKLQVTISSGIACLTDEDDAASLIKRADDALYDAKRSGRDRVKLAA